MNTYPEPLQDPRLVADLSVHPFPLPDYEVFSMSWRWKAADIEDAHARLARLGAVEIDQKALSLCRQIAQSSAALGHLSLLELPDVDLILQVRRAMRAMRDAVRQTGVTIAQATEALSTISKAFAQHSFTLPATQPQMQSESWPPNCLAK